MDRADKSEWTFDVTNFPNDLNVQIFQQLDHEVIFKDATTNEEIAECLQIMASRIKNTPNILVIATKRNNYNNGWLAQCIV